MSNGHRRLSCLDFVKLPNHTQLLLLKGQVPFCSFICQVALAWQGRRHGATGGTVPPLLTKVIFVNRLKSMRKYWGYEGGQWRHQHTWISARVCPKWFSKTRYNLYFIQLLTNFILLNLFFVIWNNCEMPFGLYVIKLELIMFARLPVA